MTKLNFDRPYFRYIDNLRRELRRQADGRGRAVSVAERGPSGDSRRNPSSEIRLSQLEAHSALDLINALGSYIDASSDLFRALAPGRKGRYGSARKRSDEAEAVLLGAAKRSFAQMLLSKSEGNSNFLAWYQQLQHRLGSHGGGAAWDILNNFAMKDAAEAVEQMLLRESRA